MTAPKKKAGKDGTLSCSGEATEPSPERGTGTTTYIVPHNSDRRASMTELLTGNAEDRVRVETAESRMRRHKEEVAAAGS